MYESDETKRIRSLYTFPDCKPVQKECDRYGIITDRKEEPVDDTMLVQRWKQLLISGISLICSGHLFPDDQKLTDQLTHLVYQGVPLCMKREVWIFLMNRSGHHQHGNQQKLSEKKYNKACSKNTEQKYNKACSKNTEQKCNKACSNNYETLLELADGIVHSEKDCKKSEHGCSKLEEGPTYSDGGPNHPADGPSQSDESRNRSENNHNPSTNLEKTTNSLKCLRIDSTGPPFSLVNYKKLRDVKSGYEYQIHVDVQRTYRNHILFFQEYSHKQCELFWCLVSYSNYNKTVGYCQGMSSFTALLLQYFCEEETFQILIHILKDIQTLFDKKLTLLHRLLNLQRQLFISVIPEIFCILKAENVDMSLFLYSWYLTLFTRFDIKLVLRIWDIFLLHGPISILPIATGILSHFSNQIAKLKAEPLITFMNTIETRPLDHKEIEEIIKKIRFAIEECDIQDMTHALFSNPPIRA